MRLAVFAALLLLASGSGAAKTIAVDRSGVAAGPVAVAEKDGTLRVSWEDGARHRWVAVFSLDSTKPVISGVTVDGRTVLEEARPVYRCSTGKRTGGWEIGRAHV